MNDCPTCGQPRPDDQGLAWAIRQVSEEDHAQRVGWFSVSVRRGTHAGWALRQDLEEAQAKALARLQYSEDNDQTKP